MKLCFEWIIYVYFLFTCIWCANDSLSCKISCKVRVPNVFLSVVAAKRRVENCAFETLTTINHITNAYLTLNNYLEVTLPETTGSNVLK